MRRAAVVLNASVQNAVGNAQQGTRWEWLCRKKKLNAQTDQQSTNQKNMKTNAQILMLGVIISWLSSLALAHAQTGFWQDSFDSYTPGTGVPVPWQGDGAGNVIVTSQQHSGTGALELDGNVGGCWESICDREIPLTNSLYIEFAIRPSSNHAGGCHPWAGLIGLRTTRSWRTAQGYWFLTLQTGLTNVVLGGYPGQAGVQAISTWRYDEWRKIGVLYQNNTTNIDLTYFIDGKKLGPYHLQSYGFESSLRYLTFGSGDGTTWIDDVSVQGLTPPSILAAPTSQVVRAGSAVTFTVSATGFPPLSYQWRLNGTDIAGATDASYTIPVTSLTSLGHYDVVISNSGGSITTTPVSLSFLDLQMFAGVIINGTPGDNYDIQSIPVLGGTNWITRTNVTLPAPQFIWIDYGTPTNSKCFYQVVPSP